MTFSPLGYVYRFRVVKQEKGAVWVPPPKGVLKFNVDGGGEREARDIRGVLRNCKGDVLFMFFKQGVKDSNEAEALAILEAFRIYLIVKNNSPNAIWWVNSHEERQ